MSQCAKRASLRLASLGLFWLHTAVAGDVGAVEIWMRAFTPDPNNAGAAQASIVAAGAGRSALKLSLQTPDFECYATDQRGFSSDPATSARLETKFTLIPTGRGTAAVRPVSQRTSAATTTQIDCSTFASVRSENGRVDKDHLQAPVVRDGVAHVTGQVVSDNAIALAGHGPSIDYSFDLTWRPLPGELTATVSVGAFPAFEMYARTPGHEWVDVVRTLPTGTPRNSGPRRLDVSVAQLTDSVTLPVLDGTWESADPHRRLLLAIHGASVTWTERNASGDELTRQVPMWFGDDAATISRANDAEVLTFLGFAPKVREEILARAPIPSFITLSIDAEGLLAEWFGVLVIKDRQDRFKTLVQPGTRKPTRYRLQRKSTPIVPPAAGAT